MRTMYHTFTSFHRMVLIPSVTYTYISFPVISISSLTPHLIAFAGWGESWVSATGHFQHPLLCHYWVHHHGKYTNWTPLSIAFYWHMMHRIPTTGDIYMPYTSSSYLKLPATTSFFTLQPDTVNTTIIYSLNNHCSYTSQFSWLPEASGIL